MVQEMHHARGTAKTTPSAVAVAVLEKNLASIELAACRLPALLSLHDTQMSLKLPTLDVMKPDGSKPLQRGHPQQGKRQQGKNVSRQGQRGAPAPVLQLRQWQWYWR
jgi:hypothetical protein